MAIRKSTVRAKELPRQRKPSRKKKLFDEGYRLCRAHFSEERVAASLLEVNRQRCKPPLPEPEVRAIAHDAVHRVEAEEQAAKVPFPEPYPSDRVSEREVEDFITLHVMARGQELRIIEKLQRGLSIEPGPLGAQAGLVRYESGQLQRVLYFKLAQLDFDSECRRRGLGVYGANTLFTLFERVRFLIEERGDLTPPEKPEPKRTAKPRRGKKAAA